VDGGSFYVHVQGEVRGGIGVVESTRLGWPSGCLTSWIIICDMGAFFGPSLKENAAWIDTTSSTRAGQSRDSCCLLEGESSQCRWPMQGPRTGHSKQGMIVRKKLTRSRGVEEGSEWVAWDMRLLLPRRRKGTLEAGSSGRVGLGVSRLALGA
jgi:hypothetical protein